jgi:Uma2 family endonuclease
MATTTNTPLMTAEELLLRPDDGLRHELIRGELTTMSPSGSEHVVIIVRLTARLFQHVEADRLGVVFGAEGGFLIARNPDTVRAPDIAFVRRERIPPTGIPRGFWPGPPDLAVEVLSPGDRVGEVDEKVGEWLAAGTLMVWIVNPRWGSVTVHRPARAIRLLSGDATLDGEDVVPGFRCPVRDLFPGAISGP